MPKRLIWQLREEQDRGPPVPLSPSSKEKRDRERQSLQQEMDAQREERKQVQYSCTQPECTIIQIKFAHLRIATAAAWKPSKKTQALNELLSSPQSRLSWKTKRMKSNESRSKTGGQSEAYGELCVLQKTLRRTSKQLIS